jgi:rod shape-determining protein MreD
MARGYRPRLEREPVSALMLGVPLISVMLGSVMTLLPFIATAPILPPLGLIMLLAWRFLVRDLWPAWIGLPLGLFDDLLSGQPLGSAAFIWTILLLIIEVFDRRMMWRDFTQDWIIGGTLIATALFLGLGFASLDGGGANPLLLVPQIVTSGLCLPLALRICAVLDRLRWRL